MWGYDTYYFYYFHLVFLALHTVAHDMKKEMQTAYPRKNGISIIGYILDVIMPIPPCKSKKLPKTAIFCHLHGCNRYPTFALKTDTD